MYVRANNAALVKCQLPLQREGHLHEIVSYVYLLQTPPMLLKPSQCSIVQGL
jgi:hypothetical protein